MGSSIHVACQCLQQICLYQVFLGGDWAEMVGWPQSRDLTHITCAFCRVGGSNDLLLLKLKLLLLNYFMKVESIFNITCFNDVKVWVEQSVFN